MEINPDKNMDREIEQWLDFEDERPCPLCGCGDYFILSKKMQFRLDCRTVVCRRCGFCFVSPLPKRKVLETFYRDAYAIYYRKIHSAPSGRNDAVYRENARKLGILEKYTHLAGKDILEVGPGRSGFLEAALAKFSKCSAIEPSSDFKKYLSEKGIEVVSDFLENAPATKKYDVIALFQVMEHFRDPVEATNKIGDLIKEDGLLILDVPDIKRPFRSLDRYFLRYVHLSYFSETTLSKLLSSCGFEVLYMESARSGSFMVPNNILAVARLKGGSEKEERKADSPGQLIRLLFGYRIKYALLDAPRINSYIALKAIRRKISASAFGAAYRRVKNIMVHGERSADG